MKNLIRSKISLLIAIVGLIGGGLWGYQTNWHFEPIILGTVSLLEIIGFILLFGEKEETINEEGHNIKNKINQNVNVNVTVGSNLGDEQNFQHENNSENRNALIDSMKSETTILFIDDDNKFNVVKLLKDSGWKNTKTVIDIKGVDIPIVKETDIFFVDINGVGKLLNLEFEGLDLALMLKQKYPDKKVVIYSANKNSNSFHPAWDQCDFKLEKNALPYQFQNLVEQFSLEFLKKHK